MNDAMHEAVLRALLAELGALQALALAAEAGEVDGHEAAGALAARLAAAIALGAKLLPPKGDTLPDDYEAPHT